MLWDPRTHLNIVFFGLRFSFYILRSDARHGPNKRSIGIEIGPQEDDTLTWLSMCWRAKQIGMAERGGFEPPTPFWGVTA